MSDPDGPSPLILPPDRLPCLALAPAPAPQHDNSENVEGGGQDLGPSHLNLIPETLVNTLSWLRRAIELDPSSYDAWHAWALMNYQLVEVRFPPLD